ncbi:MAG: FKBP-type peptidyl-prolyl cis-trans isomerase [Prevotella sp.]|jgi:FKBP-type peptidyl-prolyl cis-trans isomerase|nr:FKBP-type peptidyl-prolyl cis-trans isomerase [Prevotella sp.]
MNKKLLTLLVLFSSLLMISCSDDDNGIDEEWKSYNEDIYRKVVADPSFTARKSSSGNGTVYWKWTDFFDKEDEKNNVTAKGLKATENGTPYVTDSVIVRYEGWYYLKDGTKYVFDSTEGDNNAQVGRGLRLSYIDSNGSLAGVVDGWRTMLTNMREGQAVEVCIPQELGYGSYGNYNSSGYQTLPGYTTLNFYIKLLKIVPDNPGEFD